MTILRLGSDGSEVFVLKDRLRQLGLYDAPVLTTIFDRETDKAVRRFQAKAGLLDDGEVGPLTRGALWPHMETPAPAPTNAFRREMLAWARAQIGVHEHGENRGPEIEAWQRTAGISQGDPYCCAFVYTAAVRAAAALNGPIPLLKTGLCLSLYRWARTAGYTIAPRHAQPGDIFIMLFAPRPDGSIPGHTGLIEAVRDADTVTTIEANTHPDSQGLKSREGDGVWRRSRRLASFKALIRIGG